MASALTKLALNTLTQPMTISRIISVIMASFGFSHNMNRSRICTVSSCR